MDEDGAITVLDDSPGSVRVVLGGRVTIVSVGKLHQTAVNLAAQNMNVTVCCDGVKYMDVAVIQVLLCLGKELVGKGMQFRVTGVAGQLEDDLKLAGLAEVPLDAASASE
jgi:anti-anti-sigma factor